MTTVAIKVKKAKDPNSVGRDDLLLIPYHKLVEDSAFNPRYDYGEIDELAESIRENGIKAPFKVKKLPDGRFMVRSGHRRFRAVTKLVNEGFEVGRIRCILQRSNITEEQELFDLYIDNDGKPFTQLEEGILFRRLLNKNYTEKEIQIKLGLKNVNKVYNGVRLADSPKKIQNSIRENKISETAVLQILKDCKTENLIDYEKAATMVENAVNNVKKVSNGVEKKATAKHVNGLKAKSPIQKFTYVIEQIDKKPQNFDNKKADFLREVFGVLKNQGTEKELLELLKK